MFKLLRRLDLPRYLAIVAIIGITIGQVYSTMTLTDYVSAIMVSVSMGSVSDIWMNGGFMVLFAALMILCQSVIAILAGYVASGLATRIRKEVNEKISQMSLQEMNQFSVSSLVTRTTNDIQQFQFAVLLTLRMFFAAPITTIWAISKIQASGAWQLTLVSAVGVFVIVIGLITIMTLVLPRFKIVQKLIDKVNGITRENLTGLRVVRAYNAEKYQEDKFEAANDNLTRTQLFTGRTLACMNPIIQIVMNFVTLGIYWVGAYLINGAQGLNYPGLMQYMMLSTQIVMGFMMLLFMFIMLPRALISVHRICEVLDSKNPVDDPKEAIVPEESKRGLIEFQNVSFRYPGSSSNVVENISFSAKKGDTVAIIGSTGSGKTTIVNLIERMYDATEGAVLVDGVDVRKQNQDDLRRRIGYVPQKGILFSGTVRSNIAFSNPDLSLEEVEEAARISCADSFVSEMENTYEAAISQGGSNVSGGQKQRLCIARAVASKPEILIFDDSFSALDFKTDRMVRNNLKQTQADVTKIIVAQRIGTIMDADLILVLSEGKIVGAGKHKELLKQCPVYHEIALSQLSEEELAL